MPTPEEIAAEKEKADALAAKAKADEEAAAAKAAAGDPAADPAGLESKWDADTKKYIEKLRGEAAKNRTDKKQLNDRLTKLEGGLKSALGIESNEPPEKQIENLKAQTEAQQFRSAILEAALENGIAQNQVKYFQFLVSEAASALEEGEELSDDKMAEIVKEVKKASGSPANGGGNTSVNDKNKPDPDGDANYKDTTLEQFARLSITEKSVMYQKNPDKYGSLMKQAKEKRLI